MPRKLKVYGWTGHRSEAYTKRNHHGQTREIVAAHSMAECARLAKAKGTWALFNLCETGNAEEIATATQEPMQIFWKPRYPYGEPWKGKSQEDLQRA